MQHIVNAWDGAPDSLRFEILLGVVFFVDLYHDEYSPKRLVEQLRRYDPLTIYREGRSLGVNMAGYKSICTRSTGCITVTAVAICFP